MNILFIATAFTPNISGVSISSARFRDGLVALGHKVIVLAPHYKDHQEKDPTVIRFPTAPNPLYPDYPFVRFSLDKKLRERLSQEQIQVVHVMQPFTTGRFGLRIARTLEIPLVFTHHARYDLYAHYIPLLPSAIASRLTQRSVTRFANKCDHLIAPSQSTKDFMLSKKITKPISVIPTGLARMYTDPTPKAELRTRQGLPQNSLVMLFVSRIAIKDKNLLLLLDMLPIVLKRYPSAQLVLVGGGPDVESMRLRIKQRGLQNNVQLIGPIQNDRLSTWYSAADLFVFPSVSETQGLITLEALSAGLPVIAVQAPGNTDIIKNQSNGLLTNNNAQDFAEAILRAYGNTALYEQMSQAAWRSAKKYTVSNSARMLAAVYNKLIGTASV
ncbi:MAG: glycosyltransferase [bacterium]|nr:glycosyltransferase [bacterium]